MILRVLVATALFSISSLSHATSLSGTYVGTGPDAAILLQLVEGSGGQLSGRYEQAKLVSGPKLERYSGIASGSVDHGTVVLQWKSTELLSKAFSVSGTTDDNSLTLSGLSDGAAFQLHLSRSTEEAFRSRVAALTDRVSQAERVALEADTLRRLTVLVQAMQAVSSSVSNELKKFSPIERRFRDQTVLMAKALRKQQEIVRVDETAVMRGQVGVAINQAGVAFNQWHDELQASATQLQSKLGKLSKEAADLADRCKKNSVTNQDKSENAIALACARVRPVAFEFESQLKQLASAYQGAEAIWLEENRKQQNIIRSSDIASR
jgi:hypothetical protein